MNLEQFFSHDAVVPMKKLTDITLTAETDGFELDLTDGQWLEHSFVLMRYTPGPGAASAPSWIHFNNRDNTGRYVRLAVSSEAYEATSTDFLGINLGISFTVLFFIGRSGEHMLTGLAETGGWLYSCRNESYPLKWLTSMQIGISNNVAEGSKLELYGIF